MVIVIGTQSFISQEASFFDLNINFLMSNSRYITDKKRGIGRLKIGLFGRPFDRGQNAELWNDTLQKIADECYNNKILKEINGKFGTRNYEKKDDNAEKSLSGGSHGGTSLMASAGKMYYNNQVFARGNSYHPSFM